MVKKKKKRISEGKKIDDPPDSSFSLLSFPDKKVNQVTIVLLMTVMLFGNTLFNQYALDDGMVLKDNKFVQQGISGIPDILSHDSFYGAIGENKNLSGGRYRPFPLVCFAIEISLFGNHPFIFHLFNLLFYVLAAVVLLLFLRKFIFPQHPLAALIATVLFIIHPVHTEVVANIKSCDEILSLLFLLLTLYFLLNYINISQRQSHLFAAFLFYALALFSKENGLTFIVLIPCTIYFFSKKSIGRIIRYTIPFLIIAIFYVAIRILLIGWNSASVTEVMDNPYVLATTSQKYATIFFVLFKYLQLLVWPNPLSYDYSYNQIRYSDLSDISVLVSLLLYIAMAIYAVIAIRKKDLLSWCIIFYLGSIFIVSNLILNIGAPMAERFLFQPSVAFSIFVVEFSRRLFTSIQLRPSSKTVTGFIILFPTIILSSYVTITRNPIWKSDQTLFLHDVNIASGSARANTYAGVSLIRTGDQSGNDEEKKLYALKALSYFRKSVAIKSDYITTLLNMGVAYSRLDSADKAEAIWNQARLINANDRNFKIYDQYLAEVYYQRGISEGENKEYLNAINDFEKSLKYHPENADVWYNLGGAYFTTHQYEAAKHAWTKTLQLNPNHKQAAAGLYALQHSGVID